MDPISLVVPLIVSWIRLTRDQSNHEDGGFAEKAVLKDGLFMKVPKTLSIEEACTLGVGVSTVGQVSIVVPFTIYLTYLPGSISITQAASTY